MRLLAGLVVEVRHLLVLLGSLRSLTATLLALGYPQWLLRKHGLLPVDFEQDIFENSQFLC